MPDIPTPDRIRRLGESLGRQSVHYSPSITANSGSIASSPTSTKSMSTVNSFPSPATPSSLLFGENPSLTSIVTPPRWQDTFSIVHRNTIINQMITALLSNSALISTIDTQVLRSTVTAAEQEAFKTAENVELYKELIIKQVKIALSLSSLTNVPRIAEPNLQSYANTNLPPPPFTTERKDSMNYLSHSNYYSNYAISSPTPSNTSNASLTSAPTLVPTSPNSVYSQSSTMSLPDFVKKYNLKRVYVKGDIFLEKLKDTQQMQQAIPSLIQVIETCSDFSEHDKRRRIDEILKLKNFLEASLMMYQQSEFYITVDNLDAIRAQLIAFFQQGQDIITKRRQSGVPGMYPPTKPQQPAEYNGYRVYGNSGPNEMPQFIDPDSVQQQNARRERVQQMQSQQEQIQRALQTQPAQTAQPQQQQQQQQQQPQQFEPTQASASSSSSSQGGTAPSRSCTICQMTNAEVVFVPCGHFTCCFKCGKNCKDVAGICPVCRAGILLVQRIS